MCVKPYLNPVNPNPDGTGVKAESEEHDRDDTANAKSTTPNPIEQSTNNITCEDCTKITSEHETQHDDDNAYMTTHDQE